MLVQNILKHKGNVFVYVRIQDTAVQYCDMSHHFLKISQRYFCCAVKQIKSIYYRDQVTYKDHVAVGFFKTCHI